MQLIGKGADDLQLLLHQFDHRFLASLVALVRVHQPQSRVDAGEEVTQLMRDFRYDLSFGSVGALHGLDLALQQCQLFLDIRPVPQNLAETQHLAFGVTQGDQCAGRPEARPIGTQVPTIVLGYRIGARDRLLEIGESRLFVDHREDRCQRHPDGLLARQGEDSLCAHAPPSNAPVTVEQKDRVLQCRVQEEA